MCDGILGGQPPNPRDFLRHGSGVQCGWLSTGGCCFTLSGPGETEGRMWGHSGSRDNRVDGASMRCASVRGSPQTLALLGESFHSTSFLINVLRIVRSFLMAAVKATFFGLPSLNRRW